LRRAARGAARRTTAGGSYAGVSTGAVVLRANASDAASALFAALRPTAAGFALGPVGRKWSAQQFVGVVEVRG